MKPKQFFVYILQSKSLGKYYVGQTYDLQKRLLEHSQGFSRYTKQVKDWELVYQEVFSTCADAVMRERKIKSWKNSKLIAQLLETRQVGIHTESAT